MSESPITTSNLVSNEVVSWRKKYRPQLMNVSFFCFCLGAPFAYLGGTINNHTLIVLSFIILGVACFIPLVTQK
jgi:hypothetical protein